MKPAFRNIAVILAIVLLTGNAHAAVSLLGLNLMEDVAFSGNNGIQSFNIRFKESVGNFKGPVYYPRSVQLDFDNAYIKPAKQIIPVNGDLVSQVYIAQMDPKRVRLRLMLVKEGTDLRDLLQIGKDGRTLRISLSNNKNDLLDRLLQDAIEPSKVEAIEQVDTSFNIIGPEKAEELSEVDLLKERLSIKPEKVDTRKSFSSVSEESKYQDLDHLLGRSLVQVEDVQSVSRQLTPRVKPPAQAAQTLTEMPNHPINEEIGQEGPPDMTASALKMFSMLALVLAVMFIILYAMKKFVLKNGILGGNTPVNVLGSSMLAPRKNIMLVEVAGELLVLGISHDNITLLSRIEDVDKILKIKETYSSKTLKPVPKKPIPEAQSAESVVTQSIEKDKAAEVFAKYVKKISSEGEKKPIDNRKNKKVSAKDIEALIHKKLGALRTA